MRGVEGRSQAKWDSMAGLELVRGKHLVQGNTSWREAALPVALGGGGRGQHTDGSRQWGNRAVSVSSPSPPLGCMGAKWRGGS